MNKNLNGPGTVVRSRVPSSLLVGKPSSGGFGVMPWQQHITARHMAWGSRLMLWLSADPGQPPTRRGVARTKPLWIHLASTLLTRMHPTAHPALTLLRTSQESPAPTPAAGPALAHRLTEDGPLTRMAAGLRALGPVSDITTEAMQPGPWCCSAPLWNNPLLKINTPAHPHPLATLATLPNLHTIGDLAQLRHNLQSRDRDCLGAAVGTSRAALRLAAEFMWRAIPTSWREEVPHPPAVAELPRTPHWGPTPLATLGRLGWHQAGIKARLLHLSVSRGTLAQLSAARASRETALIRHITTSDLPPGYSTPGTLKALRTELTAVWKLPWEPRNKETLWRLINNGISGAGGHDNPSHRPCPCGWAPPKGTNHIERAAAADTWRSHAFWGCPVAQAVSGEVDKAFKLPEPTKRHHIWLLHPPPATPPIDPAVWRPVTVAALAAMEHGRKSMYAMREEEPTTPSQPQPQPQPQPQQQQQQQRQHRPRRCRPTPAFQVAIPTRAANAAIAMFWCLLQDLADTGESTVPTARLLAELHPAP